MSTFFFYQDNEKRNTRFTLDIENADAHKYLETHYHNLFVLDFLSKNETDFAARQQASHEMTICERKIKFWENHHSFDLTRKMRQIARIRNIRK